MYPQNLTFFERMLKRPLLLGLGLLIVIAIGWFFFQERFVDQARSSQEMQARDFALNVANLRSAGDLQNANQTYQAILTSGESTLVTAPSVLAGSHFEYLINPTVPVALKSIAELKRIVADENTRPFIRALAVMQLALWPNLSDYDEEIFQAIFSDNLYRKFVIVTKGTIDVQYTVRNALKESYAIYPTYASAIEIADNYVIQLYKDEQLQIGLDKNDFLISQAEEYLAKAEDISKSKLYEQPVNTSVYQKYLASRAFTIAGLAHFKGAPYKAMYKVAYEDLFRVLTQANTDGANAYLSFSRFLYAHYLIQVDGDTSSARQQLLQAIELAKKDKNFASNPLVRHIRKEKFSKPPYQAPARMEVLISTSSDFKTFVDSIK